MISSSFPSFFSRHRHLFIWCGVLALLFLVSPELMAQEGEEGLPAPKTWLQKWVLDGGVWMAPLGFCSVITISLSVLCLMSLSKGKFVPNALKSELTDLMHQCRVRSAIESSAQSPTFLGRMLTVGLPHFDVTNHDTLGRDRVDEAMAEFAVSEMRPYQKWVGYLSVIAQIAPMLGLFGTVIGMVGAFETLSVTGGAEPAKLAGDISIALLTTFSGLFVAIPSLALFYIFKNRLNDLVANTLATGTELVDVCVDAAHGDVRAARIPEGLAVADDAVAVAEAE
jgi:biopolymer transport protein ExbB